MKDLLHNIAPADGPPERKSPASVDALDRAKPEGNLNTESQAETHPRRKPGRRRLTAFVNEEHRAAEEAFLIADGLESVAKLAAAQFDRAPSLQTERVARLALHAWTAQRRAMRAHTGPKRTEAQP